MIDKGALPFTPDKAGYFPIDYAGKFENFSTVKLLVDHSVLKFTELQANKTDEFDTLRRDTLSTHNELLKKKMITQKRVDNMIDHPDSFLISPLYATSLLYWAARVEEVPVKQVKFILDNMEAYPEGANPMASELERTACHSVVIGGNLEKMKLIYTDFSKRHKKWKNMIEHAGGAGKPKMKIKPSAALFKKKNTIPEQTQALITSFIVLLDYKRLKVLKTFYNNSFWNGMFKFQNMDHPFSNMQDREKNTPLHLAAMWNNEDCTVELLTEHKCAIDIRNHAGIMAKDIGAWHDKIGRVFKDFYSEFDKEIGVTQGKDDKDEKYSEKIAGSFKNQLQQDRQAMFKRLVTPSKNPAHMKDIENILKERSQVPILPSVVLKMNIKDNLDLLKCNCCRRKRNNVKKKILNDFLRQLDATDFIIGMFKSVVEEQYLVTVDLHEDVVEQEAVLSKYMMKLHGFSAKIPFIQSQKNKMHTFKSKDTQFLIIQKMERMFDLHKLKKEGVLVGVVPIHDDQSLFVLDKKYNKPYRFVPHAFSTFKAFFQEDFENTRFSDVMAYMNYFGEKNGISNTFFEFCTIYMMVPALVSLLLTVWMYNTQIDTIWSVAYSVFIAIWSTYMIERWKRKEKHIAYKWGAIKSTGADDDELKENPDYLGYESFSWSNYFISKRNPFSLAGTLYLAGNVVVSFLLILLSIFLYVLIKEWATSGELTQIQKTLITGVVLTVVTGTTNVIYKHVANFFVTKENYKYATDKERSFMLKLVLFRLVNTNITIVYALVKILMAAQAAEEAALEEDMLLDDETEEQPSKYAALYGVILATVAAKAASPLYSRYYFRHFMFSLNKWLYFSKVAKLGKAQEAKHHAFDSTTISNEEKASLQLKSKMFIFKNVLEGDYENYQTTEETMANVSGGALNASGPKNASSKVVPAGEKGTQKKAGKAPQAKPVARKQSGDPCYQRFLFNNGTGDNDCIENDQVLIDSIEVNALMNIKSPLQKTSDMTERFLMLSFGIIYAGICPPATLIVFLYMLIDIWAMRYTDMYCIQRPVIGSGQTMGPWNTIAEFIIGAVIVINAVMMYILSESLTESLDSFGFDSTNRMWMVIGVEHVIFLSLVVIKVGIPDMPRKMRKLLIRTQAELGNLKGIGDQARLEQLQKENEQLRKNQGGKTERERIMDDINYHQKDISEIDVRPGRLADFLGIDPRQKLYEETMEILEQGLQQNFEIKLFRESFLLIERAILQRKLSAIYNSNKVILINCTECTQEMSTVYCHDCEDHFCQSCFDQFHATASTYKSHVTTVLQLNPTGLIPVGPKQSTVASTSGPGQKKGTDWRKFEYFNFPLPESNDHFNQLRLHFERLKKAYVDYNYIDCITGKMDLKSVFVDQNYDSLQRENGRTLKRKHIKKYGRKVLTTQKESVEGTASFNEEELFYLNRVIFRLFKNSGPVIHFDSFIRDLTILQTGKLTDRLNLWLNMVCELEEDLSSKTQQSDQNLNMRIISRNKFGNVIRASFPQDVAMKQSFELIVDKIFSNGLDDVKPLDKLHSFIMNNKEARTLMSCVLQYEDEMEEEM